jgi:predicted dehydrogenase
LYRWARSGVCHGIESSKDSRGVISVPYCGLVQQSRNRFKQEAKKTRRAANWIGFVAGPAPRRPDTDNVHPYNWHWFTNYGTGETLNNGTHEVDVCRWALGVEYPKRVTSSGGRYHFKDDWQFYDTLVTSYEYEDRMLSWEGKSCQGMKFYGRDRGSAIMGTTGTVVVDRDGYEIYDLKGKKTGEFKVGSTTSSSDLTGRDSMTDAHFANFIAGIRKGEKLNAPVSAGNVAVTMLQLSNIAWEVNRELHLDTKDGKVQGDPEAMKMWGREYEKGWAPHV